MSGAIRVEITRVKQWACSFLFRTFLSMNCGSLDGKLSILLCWRQTQSTIELGEAESIFSDSAVTRAGFVVDVFDELDSLRVSAH